MTVAGRNIAEVAAMSVGDAAAFFTGLELSDRDAFIAARVLKEINARLGFLLDVGLDATSASTRPRPPWPAARPSGSGWPPRSARG